MKKILIVGCGKRLGTEIIEKLADLSEPIDILFVEAPKDRDLIIDDVREVFELKNHRLNDINLLTTEEHSPIYIPKRKKFKRK